MDKLVSGMILVEKVSKNLNYFLATPYGYRAIDADGFCIEFDVNRYEKAYVPKDYNNCWEPLEGTVIEL